MRAWLAILLSLLATAAVAGFSDFGLSGFSLSGGTCSNVAQIPVMTVTPSSYAFGTVTTGSTRVARFFLSNTGKGSFTNLSTNKVAGIFRTYSTADCEAATLTAGQQCRFNIAYTPTAAVLSNYSTQITTDQYAAATVIPISGTGISTCTGNSSTGLLVYQNFETATTGYDNSETWTETVGTGGTVEAADTTATVLRGTQQLKIVAGDAGQLSTARRSIAANGTVYAYFLYKTSGIPAALGRVFSVENSSQSAQVYIQVQSDGKLRINHGSAALITTDAISANMLYHIWVRYTKGTGADGVYSVAFNTVNTEPTSGSKFVGGTNGTATADIAFVRLNGYVQMTNYFDQVLIKTTTLGAICD